MTRSPVRSLPLVLALAFPGLLTAQAKPATVTVSAQGSVEAQPDTAVAQFSIRGQNLDVKAAYAAAQQQAEELRTQLREQGFTPQEATWSEYSVSPNVDYRTNRVTSYTVSAEVQLLVTDFRRIAPLINAMSGSGSSTLRSVSFELRHGAAAQKLAIAAAYAAARAQAEALAAAAEVRLGKLVSASVGAQPMATPQVRLMVAAMAPAPTEQFTPQKLTVTASVTAVYQLVRP